MLLPLVLALLLVPGLMLAWDTQSHQRITQAALDALPKQLLERFGAERQPLIEIYSLYPDRYAEMTGAGFVRKSPGPKDAASIEVYCLRPDGEPVHSATFDRDEDSISLMYLFERIVTQLAARSAGEAARYVGVLSHFIADSLSPPHSVPAADLLALAPDLPASPPNDLHSVLERGLPAVALTGRAPRSLGEHLLPAAEALLDQCYAAAELNRKALPELARAVREKDEKALDAGRRRAGMRAAEMLSDTLLTLIEMSDKQR